MPSEVEAAQLLLLAALEGAPRLRSGIRFSFEPFEPKLMIGALFPFAQTTDGVTVRVSVSFLPEQSQPGLKRWFWAYHIRIENDGELPVQLLTRHWRIVDGTGEVHEVMGEGVVGVQPIIAPGSSYDYVSGCPLTTPEGSMVGSYEMVDGDDRHFLVAIPHFPLVAPSLAS